MATLMAESNLHALDINLIVAMSEEEVVDPSVQVSQIFTSSPWYSDIVCPFAFEFSTGCVKK